MADSSRHDLFLLPEVTYGTTPAADPAFVDVRHTGTTLALSKDGFQSEELHADRQIRDFRHGVEIVGGDIPVEFSYTSFDTILEALLGGTWATDVLKAGTTRRSFSILRHFTDLLAAAKPYHLFSGVEFNTLNLSVPASGIVTGSFGVMGKALSILGDLTSLTDTTGPTFGTPLTTKPFDSFTGSITEGGSAIATVTQIDLTLENGLAARNVIGSAQTIRPGIGRCNLTGSLTAFFEDAVLLEKFINETESALVFTLTDAAGNDIQFDIPRVKYNGGQPDVSGQGSITINLPFQALYNDGDASNIVITRTAV